MKKITHFTVGVFSDLLFGSAAGQWLRPIMHKYFFAIHVILILSLIAAAAGLIPPYLTKLLIDEGIMAKNYDALLHWALVLFAIGFGSVLLGAVNSLVHLKFSAHMLGDVRRKMLFSILRVPPSQHHRHRMGELMTRLDSDCGEVQQFAFNALLSGVGSVFRLLGGAFMLFLLDWRLALIVILFTPLELIFVQWARPYTESYSENVREKRGKLSSFLAESLSGRSTLKALGAEAMRIKQLIPFQEDHISASLKQRQWQEFSNAVPTILNALNRSIILLIGGYWILSGRWEIGSLIAFLAYMGFLIGPIRTLIGLYHSQAKVKVAMKRIMEIADSEDLEDLSFSEGSQKNTASVSLSVKALTFSYESEARQILADFTLDLKGGEKALLKAPSGAGKTTFINLLAGNLALQSGKIETKPLDVNSMAANLRRRFVSIVPQVSYFFNGSIAENLRIGNELASEDDLIRVLETVCLYDWLVQDKQGLKTEISEHGVCLSGGQRQRLALARTLLCPMGILIMDESFSEIDNETSSRIMKNIDQDYSELSRIIIAHANSDILGPYDKIIELPPPSPDLERSRTCLGEQPNHLEKALVNAV